jgi:hypothetical protein
MVLFIKRFILYANVRAYNDPVVFNFHKYVFNFPTSVIFFDSLRVFANL